MAHIFLLEALIPPSAQIERPTSGSNSQNKFVDSKKCIPWKTNETGEIE